MVHMRGCVQAGASASAKWFSLFLMYILTWVRSSLEPRSIQSAFLTHLQSIFQLLSELQNSCKSVCTLEMIVLQRMAVMDELTWMCPVAGMQDHKQNIISFSRMDTNVNLWKKQTEERTDSRGKSSLHLGFCILDNNCTKYI